MNKIKEITILIGFITISILCLLLWINALYKWIWFPINNYSYENLIISLGFITLLIFTGYLYWFIPTSKVIKRIIKVVKK
jgi:hypothetical protein